MPSITLIYLVYNEQESLAGVVAEGMAYCKDKLDDWEIVLVDDGSTDDSPAIAAELSAQEARVRVVTHGRNRGMGAGMTTGIEAARKQYLMFMPADGQTPVDALDDMLPLLADADVVVTTYSNARETRGRSFLSDGLRLFMRFAAGIRFELQGLYLFPTHLAKDIAPHVRGDTFFFSFELIDRAQRKGARLAATTMRCLPRQAGASKVANSRRILRVAREVADYAWRKRRGA